MSRSRYNGVVENWKPEDPYYNMRRYELEVDIERKGLLALSDTDLLNQILSHPHPSRLNTVVPNRSFPAHEIALKIKENGWTPTPKQRQALINVYSHDMVYVQRRLDLENKRPKPIKALSKPVTPRAMTKEEFAARWDSDDSGGGITFDEIADCAKTWGLFGQPKSMDIDRVSKRVVESSGAKDAY